VIFRPNMSTADQNFTVYQIMKKYINHCICHLFIDFKQTFYLIWREGLSHIPFHFGIPLNLFCLMRDIYTSSEAVLWLEKASPKNLFIAENLEIFNLILSVKFSQRWTKDSEDVSSCNMTLKI
jgi:hypothetical protein